MMRSQQLQQALENSDVVHDTHACEAAIAKMADAIVQDFAARPDDGLPRLPPLFITVLHGGLPFAGQLAFALGVRGLDVQFEYLHASRYRGQMVGSGLAWLHRPATHLRGRDVILVDDILDEGHTLLAIKRWCEDEYAASVKIAVLARKVHARCAEGIYADYIGVDVPDRYVFGYGMDFHEQGRNLPAIYALKES